MWRIGVAIAIVVLMLGCDGDSEPKRRDAQESTCEGAPLDLSEEPKYSADYLVRWQTAEGCPVRLDYAMTREGACFDRVDEILLGWPPLTSSQEGDSRIFVRDPSNRGRDPRTAAAYDPDTELPGGAQDTGLRQRGAELWWDGEEGEFVFLVHEDHTERWPHDPEPPTCA